jgi:hypothetical protein
MKPRDHVTRKLEEDMASTRGQEAEARERDDENHEKEEERLTDRLSNPDFNPLLKGHTLVSSIALES